MAISPSLGCIYFTACVDGVRYVKYPEENIVFELGPDGSTQVTDQAVIDSVVPAGCDDGTVKFWAYVPFDPSLHLAGPVVGEGTEEDPCQIPLPFIDEDLILTKAATGGTVPFGVTLADGTVVPAGDPLPANVCVTYYVDGEGLYDPLAPGGETVFEVDGDTNHTPEVYLPGDTVEYDITLPDGTVVPAGDPLPDGYCAFLEIDTEGNVVETDVQVKTEATGGECCEYVYVPFDPDVHIDGDPAVGDGSAGDPFQIPLSEDICTALSGLPAGDPCQDLTGVQLVTGDCETVSAEDISKPHIFAQCEGLTEVATDFVPDPPQAIASMIEYPDARGNMGELVVGAANMIDNNMIRPLTINIPAASSTDCVQFLEVAYGGHVGVGDALISLGAVGFDTSVAATTGDVGAITQKINHGAWIEGNPTVNQVIYAINPTGTNGGTVDIDFLNSNGPVPPADGLYSGVLNWTVWEVCPNNGSFDETTFCVATQVVATDSTDDSPVNPADEAVDFGDCDALYFGVSRHVNSTGNSGDVHTDTDWSTFDNPAVAEITDKVSRQGNVCQMGTTAGWVPGLSGAINYTSTANQDDTFGPINASWTGLAIDSCEPSDNLFATSEKKELELTNGCNYDSILEAEINAVLNIEGTGPAHYCVTPVINGQQVTNMTQNVYVPGSANLAFNWVDAANPVPPNGSVNVSVCFRIEQKVAGPDDVVTVGGVTVNAELSPI